MLCLPAAESAVSRWVSSPANFRRGAIVAIAVAGLGALAGTAHAGGSLRAGGMSGLSRNGSSSASATSQTATAATDNTSSTVTSSVGARQAQASLAKSVQALQALQAAQNVARNAALNGANNLGLNPDNPSQTLPNVADGLGGGAGLTGGLVPAGTLTATSTPSVQIVKLGSAGNNTLNLTSGGTVVVPEGTSGSDLVTVTGPGSVTSTGGSVTASAGSLTTSSGATLSSVQGGSISLTGGSSTLAVVTTTKLTSTLSGTITLANSGGTFPLAAGTATTIPAGSTISFSGTGAGTVTIAGSTASTSPSTVSLEGAGTLTLANAPAGGTGGTITTTTGVVSFSSGVTTTLPAGSTINLTGAGALSFAGAANDTLSVLLNTGQNGTLNGTNNFTTTGSLLSTTSFNVPGSWVLGTGGALSQSFDAALGHYTDTVTQEQQQALLYWSSFNIGKNTTLDFDQSAGGANVGQWVAINEITNPTLNPTQILGSIKAPGQVYVIDQNGIIFGGSSQVNVGALTASSLALNPSYINNGLLNDSGDDYQFQFSSLFITSTGYTGTGASRTLTTTVAPLWTEPPATPSGGSETVGSEPAGNVTVQTGAQLTSPANANSQGGRVALIAPNVTNQGTISTPDGQTILAAGLQVGLSAHNSNDASLRGLDVFVGKVSAGAATLPSSGKFTFNGLPNNAQVTFAGSGQVGSYTAPGSATVVPILANTPTSIPVGSTVTMTGGTASYAAFSGGNATNAANTLDGQGNILTPGGDIEAPEGDVTMTGSSVNQLGIIDSATSVTLNGRIDLLADYNSVGFQGGQASAFYPTASGTVTFGGQSVTQILPETSSAETTIGTQLAFSSLVDVQGLAINMLAGSLLYAPGASEPSSASGAAYNLAGQELTSGVTFDAGSWSSGGNPPNFAQTLFSNSNGEITLDPGATLDVSGLENVSASVAQDVIPVQLRGPQLANSSLQRDGALRGTTVYIDIRDYGTYDGTAWIGTPIGDVSGYVNDIQRTVGELSANGGSVALDAGASVSIGSGAAVNVSGGWINYAGAQVQTTSVMENGQAVNISQATPNLSYSGLASGYTVGSAKWGVTQTFVNSLLTGTQYDPGFVQGGNAGSISIASPGMTLSGNFYGTAQAGTGQRTLQSTLNSTYASATFLPTLLATAGLPDPGQLSLSFLQLTNGRQSNVYGATSPNVSFETDATIAANPPSSGPIDLSQDLINVDGFGDVSIASAAGATVLVPQGVTLTLPDGGSLSISAANIDIEGEVAAPGGGSLSFAASNVSAATATTDPGTFTLGADAAISASGLVVDDRSGVATAGTEPLALNGGAIKMSGATVDLAAGSTIDVSGGVSVGANSQITYGTAGSVSILAQDQLTLGATLTGYSGAVGGGGSLTLQAPLVQIGGSQLLNGDSSTAAIYSGEAGVSGNGNTLWLDPAGSSADFFSEGGFGSFDIEGVGQIETNASGVDQFANGNPLVSPAILIAANTKIDPVVQAFTVESGGSISLVPLSAAEAASLLPSQRTSVNLVFDALGVVSSSPSGGPPLPGGGTFLNLNGGGGLLVRGDIVMQSGASITTGPQTKSSRGVSLLAANGLVGVLGSIVAPGGSITIQGGNTTSIGSNDLLFYDSSQTVPFATVDLGPDSVLSAAGAFEQTVNTLGLVTGSVLPGGNVKITGNLVAESGAEINVSGSSALVSESNASLGVAISGVHSLSLMPTRIDSNAGTITFNAPQLFYSDATLLGNAGGPAAQGGSISLTAGFSATVTPTVSESPPTPLDVTVIISQEGLNGGSSLPGGIGTGLSLLGQAIPGSDTAIGATVNSANGGEGVFAYFAAEPNLFLSTTADPSTNDNGGRAGGFGSLTIPGTIDFVGPVAIKASNSLNLALSSGNSNAGETGGVIFADSSVVLTAPYVALNSYATALIPDQVDEYPMAAGGAGSLTVNAGVLADVGNLSLQNIGVLSFNGAVGNSGFVPATTAGDIRGIGTLQVAGQINLDAAQIYPPTEDTFAISGNAITVTAPTGQALPALPLSAGGTLDLDATTIEQDGVLRAPFGVINLGSGATQSLVLSAGSITSVSGVDPTTGAGITVPYGIIDSSGQWFDPQGNNITLTGPPVKAINIVGQAVDLQSGSTVDVSGGGNLYAYQFNPGTGGTEDILGSLGTNDSSTSFAILPGYSLGYAPDGTYGQSTNLETNNVTDVGYYNSSLAVGEEVYLNGSNGLPAGDYTLLPARYAALPGAYLITPNTVASAGASVTNPDGASVVSGYVGSSLNPAASPTFNSYLVYTQADVLNMAPYAVNLANTYFPASAAANKLATPPLPEDAGQLLLEASTEMTIQGSLLSQPGQGGQGGSVDIASTGEIDIVGPNTDTGTIPAGALVLESSQLTGFGAASLLIGGISTEAGGVDDVTVTTSDIVVDDSGATTTVGGTTVNGLAAPDLTLVSSGVINVADGATLGQFGTLAGAAPTLVLQGNGSLLRVSSDSSAQIVRQNVVAGDTTSLLGIGQGASILGSDGGAAGALILDSSGVVQISTSTASAPTLRGRSLTIDSSQINLELSTPATAPTSGLVITAPQLASLLGSTQSLSLLSYSSIALYGSGQIGAVTAGANGQSTYQETSIALHADDIYYADTQNSSGVTINAQTVTLDNLPGGVTLPTLAGLGTAASLTINAQTIALGSNALHIDQFADVALNAQSEILLKGLGATSSGSDATPTAATLTVGGNLTLTAPLMTAATSGDQAASPNVTSFIDMAINATGAMVLQAPANATATTPVAASLGAQLSLGAGSIDQESGGIILNSGVLALQATGATGAAAGIDLVINGTLNVSGVAPQFFNLTKYTDGGSVTLGSASGNVTIGSAGRVDVSAASGDGTVDSGAGSAGSLTVNAAGLFTPGQLVAQGGTVTQNGTVIAQGSGGSFTLNAGTLNPTGPGDATLSALESALTGFATQSIGDQDDTTVTVAAGETISASSFSLSANGGTVIVAGTINASNVPAMNAGGQDIQVGGTVSLQAAGSVNVASTGIINVSGTDLSDAGQGGSVSIQAGTYETGALSSTAAINLAGQIDLAVNGGNAGTLVLSAPQITGGAYVSGASYTPVAVSATAGGAPTDVALAPISAGVINGASSVVVDGVYVQDAKSATANIDSFEGAAESNAATFTGQASSIESRIFGSSTAANVQIEPGEEIDNSVGNLVLKNSWDLSQLRYGAQNVPGVLTLRAAGNIVFDFLASLTDGFSTSANGVSYLDPLLPVGSQSWSYNITSGADFNSANIGAVQSAAQLQAGGFAASQGAPGSVEIGYQSTPDPTLLDPNNPNLASHFFQTIRTGTGNITINSGGDVLLLDNLATIYTAGSQVDPTLGGTFTAPHGTNRGQTVPAAYSDDGGNVAVAAQGMIAHETYDPNGTSLPLVADSSAELPTSWLDREGSATLPTTWWVDFTNFFEGIGALGGGNVNLTAGGSIVNVDAVVPTNAREVNGQLTELGGGDLTVRAGGNLDGGVYYVERGQGTLGAGNSIITNATRAAAQVDTEPSSVDNLPTTLFLGDGSFSVSANGSLLLGPVANPFLLPQSYNNIASSNDTTSEQSYFSTYGSADAINAESLTGTLGIEDYADGGQGSLYDWYINVLNGSPSSPLLGIQLSSAEPWLELAAAGVSSQNVISGFGPTTPSLPGALTSAYGGITALMPATLRATAFTGDLDLIGSVTLSPEPQGTLNLLAGGAINAFNINQEDDSLYQVSYGSSVVNVSDTNPDILPTSTDPVTTTNQVALLSQYFNVTGATTGLTLGEKLELHADVNGEPLHTGDSNPVYIYAENGDISGLTLFSPKQTQIIAGGNITDIGFYLQNDNSADISLIQAGGDIIAYDADSPLRLAAGTNVIGYNAFQDPVGDNAGAPNSGDIQIAGPGTLEVLAGGNLTLGNDSGLSPNNNVSTDGLYAGLVSIGGNVNPTLPFLGGANLIAAAGLDGIGSATGLTPAELEAFDNEFLNPSGAYAATYLPDLASALNLGGITNAAVWSAFQNLPAAEQDTLALDMFYLVLRDAGRDHNDASSPGYGTYAAANLAISELFPSSSTYKGDIDITSREIKTNNGGDIDLLTPGGQVTVGIDLPSAQAVNQGILTVDGGNINIFASGSVNVGTSRIFTLHGGNEIIWSTTGNIAAGASSKTVLSAPPTRVLVDPTSGAVELDLAGLATGGGIGVLETEAGVPPGDVDLIAPAGIVDAGDAGIRASGNLNIAAAQVLNAGNISVGGKSSGVPTGASVNIGALAAASSAAGSSESAAGNGAPNNQQNAASNAENELPSIITVDVLGFGGDDTD